MMMRKPILAPAVGALMIVFATGAHAKAITGTIQSIDKRGDSITLTDGKSFTLPEGIEAETLKPGEKVVVTYTTTKSGKLAASKIHVAK
jgi:hypothetical protein